MSDATSRAQATVSSRPSSGLSPKAACRQLQSHRLGTIASRITTAHLLYCSKAARRNRRAPFALPRLRSVALSPGPQAGSRATQRVQQMPVG